MSYRFQKPARPVSRVFLHCSASDNPDHDSAATIDAWHREKGWAGIGYHFFIRKDGRLEKGRDLEKVPAAQENNNVGTIAICLHGLAKEKFTEAQMRTLRGLCLDIDHAYAGRVSFHGHCEVARKACPVFDYRVELGLDRDGHLHIPRDRQSHVSVDLIPGRDAIEVEPIRVSILKTGTKGDLVRHLQQLLNGLGYFTGAIDGDFGPRTRAAVLAFQADNHLTPDGVVGPLTREALAEAGPRPVAPARAAATLGDLAASGSRIASASIGNGIAGIALTGTGAAAVLDDLTGAISAITGQSDAISRLFADHGPIAGGVILAAGLFVAWQSWRAGRARLDDHRTGKTS